MRWFLIMILLITGAQSPAFAQNYDKFDFRDDQGKKVKITGNGRNLLLFWRDDCAPCLVESKLVPQIAAQNPNLEIKMISLGKNPKIPPLPHGIVVLSVQSDARALLQGFGNQRALALPYSVMLGAKGNLCASHYGILAPQIVSEWVKKC